MPRPVKCRRVCKLPQTTEFAPIGSFKQNSPIIMTVDEYETIRLIDKEELSQEECAKYMHIARTTVQQIYTMARKKLAISIVDGLPLQIKGGSYCLCDEKNEFCNHKHCCKCKNKSEENK